MFVLESDYLLCATLQNMSVNDPESLEMKGAEMRCSRRKIKRPKICSRRVVLCWKMRHDERDEVSM